VTQDFLPAYLDNLRAWGGASALYALRWWASGYVDHPRVVRACWFGRARTGSRSACA
jgi:hypothetical protein